MSTTPEPTDEATDDTTTVEIDRSTRRALGKLQNDDETLGDTVAAGLRALKETEPERLQVDL
jgi:hypothetical protein